MWLVGRRWPALASASWPGNDVPVAWPVVGAVLGGFLVLHMTEDMVYGPEAFSQSLDNSFHMNAIRWIQEHGDASSPDDGCCECSGPGAYLLPGGLARLCIADLQYDWHEHCDGNDCDRCF